MQNKGHPQSFQHPPSFRGHPPFRERISLHRRAGHGRPLNEGILILQALLSFFILCLSLLGAALLFQGIRSGATVGSLFKNNATSVQERRIDPRSARSNLNEIKRRSSAAAAETAPHLDESLSSEPFNAPKVLRRSIPINPRTQSAERREKNGRTSIGPRRKLDLAMAAPHLPVESLPVRAESAPIKDSPSAEKIQQINDGSFTLEIATFKQRKSANELLIKLKAAGYNGSSQSVEVGKKTFHRVRQGLYNNLEEANRHALKLAKETGRSIKVIRVQ